MSKLKTEEDLIRELAAIERRIKILERASRVGTPEFDSPFLKLEYNFWYYAAGYWADGVTHDDFYSYYEGQLVGVPKSASYDIGGGSVDGWYSGTYYVGARLSVDGLRAEWAGALENLFTDSRVTTDFNYLFGPDGIPAQFRPAKRTRVVISHEGNWHGSYDALFDAWIEPDGSLVMNNSQSLSFTRERPIPGQQQSIIPRLYNVSYRIDRT